MTLESLIDIEAPAIAGASLRTGVKTGKFHGLNAATGPTG